MGNFPYVLAYTPGMIPSPTAVKAACGPTEIIPRNCAFNSKPIGAGPFKVDSYRPKESINLVRNDNYWGGKPYLDSLSFVVLAGARRTMTPSSPTPCRWPSSVKPRSSRRRPTRRRSSYINLEWLGGVALLNNGKLNCKGGLPAPYCTGKPDGVTTSTRSPPTNAFAKRSGMPSTRT